MLCLYMLSMMAGFSWILTHVVVSLRRGSYKKLLTNYATGKHRGSYENKIPLQLVIRLSDSSIN